MPKNTPPYAGPPPAQDAEPDTLIVEDQSLRYGFVQLPKLVLYARNVTRDAKLLYAVLLGYAWQEGRCFPGYSRLCYDMGASENTVRVYMRELETVGLLKQRRRGLGKTNIYILLDLRTAKIEVQEPQKSRTSEIAVQEPAKTAAPEHKKTEAYKETEGIETDQQYTEINSNKRNSSVFHSNSAHARLSTALHDRTFVENDESSHELEDDAEATDPSGWTSLRQMLTGRQPLPGSGEDRGGVHGPGRPPKAPPAIAQLVTEITAWLHDDPKNVRSNTTRAVRLWKTSGLPEDKFIQRLYEARSITKQQGGVKKPAADGHGTINRVPYFFAVLEDQLGLKERPA